ncbi:hypothetical protein B0H16DRAFT_389291 [Mycena metata]|uniref:Uncharacterized protein n=1 Tax=Mycena metata TaxID=1033252 RepID=A0AAD7MJH1_9AGAR|nr:hypothetical protein B0H16DRAFT_389291 [Mycena metata]
MPDCSWSRTAHTVHTAFDRREVDFRVSGQLQGRLIRGHSGRCVEVEILKAARRTNGESTRVEREELTWKSGGNADDRAAHHSRPSSSSSTSLQAHPSKFKTNLLPICPTSYSTNSSSSRLCSFASLLPFLLPRRASSSLSVNVGVNGDNGSRHAPSSFSPKPRARVAPVTVHALSLHSRRIMADSPTLRTRHNANPSRVRRGSAGRTAAHILEAMYVLTAQLTARRRR